VGQIAQSGGRVRSFHATKEPPLNAPSDYTGEHAERLAQIHQRLIEARRELDALIGDAYLRPRASIVPVHFLDLASAVEKLRWAEKEWRELDKELAARADRQEPFPSEDLTELREPVDSSAR
jgi:hypothetical protein